MTPQQSQFACRCLKDELGYVEFLYQPEERVLQLLKEPHFQSHPHVKCDLHLHPLDG